MVDWFEALFGFPERGADVQQVLVVDGDELTSPVNGARYGVGVFGTPSLGELRAEVARLAAARERPAARRRSGVLGGAAKFHGDNPGATFQGPCCAIACGPATVYRNYFANVDGQVGQTRERQLENLGDVLDALGPVEGFDVRGGYTLADDRALDLLSEKIGGLDARAYDDVCAKLRVGVQVGCQVTALDWGRRLVGDRDHAVTQVFGSACSVAYSRNAPAKWKPLASLVLRASYEATLLVAARNALERPDDDAARRVYLTAVGGGVFGNPLSWIGDAVSRALAAADALAGVPLDVNLVTYCAPVPRPFLEIAAARSAPPSRKRDRSPAPAPATEAPAAATPPPPPPGGPDVSLEALKSDAPKPDVSLAALLAKARAKAAKGARLNLQQDAVGQVHGRVAEALDGLHGAVPGERCPS
ncbi:hypothetical protein JL721_9363 [Aureococcus anophagefferens]|nr:hypothetical protein JL721_9363 [Aureococcus anophagefferens]